MISDSNKSYIICAPVTEKSAGSRMLYSLREELECRGFNAKIFCFTRQKNNRNKNIFISKISEENRQNDIVIYPDIIEGNPLLFRNVVRYMLNVPGRLGGDASYHHGETLFAFDDYCAKDVPYLRQDMIDRKLFFDSHSKKDVDCYFVHKRGKFRDIKELKDCIEINSKWPKSRFELAKLLQRTGILYSYDDNSCLLQEAALCGAKVKIIQQDAIVDYQMDDQFDADVFENQMQHFIQITQSLNYRGEINRNGYYTINDFCKFFIKRNYLKLKLLIMNSDSDRQKLKDFKKKMPKIYNGGTIIF